MLPARLEPYYTAWLDGLFQESDLLWRGAGKEKLALLFPPDLDLLPPPPSPADEDVAPAIDEVFGDQRGRYGFDELLRQSSLGSADLSDSLWRWAWSGRVSNTSFLSVRRGLLSKFKPAEAVTAPDEQGYQTEVLLGRLI